MIRIVGALAAVALGTTMVMAQNIAPIQERQAIMKKISDDAKTLGAMVKGETTYDAAKATAILTGWEAGGKKFVTLFPEDSKTGEKTRAKPEIWQNKADFEAKAGDFLKAVAGAKGAASIDAFKSSYSAVGKSCDGCHEKYRGPRPS